MFLQSLSIPVLPEKPCIHLNRTCAGQCAESSKRRGRFNSQHLGDFLWPIVCSGCLFPTLTRTQPPLQRTRPVNAGYFGRSDRNGVTRPTSQVFIIPVVPLPDSSLLCLPVSGAARRTSDVPFLGQVEEFTEGSGGATGVEMRIDITAKKGKVLHQFLCHTCRCSELFYILCQTQGICFVGFLELFDDFLFVQTFFFFVSAGVDVFLCGLSKLGLLLISSSCSMIVSIALIFCIRYFKLRA